MAGPIDQDLKCSDARLWALIEERTKPEADVATIDRRIWDLFGEDWAIVFTDLSGFSRKVAEFGIIHFLQVIHEQKKLLLPIVRDHDGILMKAEGDSFLLTFRRAASALDCSIAMQHACQNLNARRVPEEQIILCLGIGYGHVLRIGDHDVWGAQVNAASKLGEDTAGPDEILVTDAARAAIGARTDVTYAPLDITIPGATGAFRCTYPRP